MYAVKFLIILKSPQAFMAPKFGNYLFRNLKSAGAPEKASTDPTGTMPVEDQEIVLRPVDFTTEIGGALNWASRESREIRVKLGQTDGLMEGRITISAKMLRHLYPGLVPEQLKEESTFPLSLRSVVLQLQNVVRAPNDVATLSGAPDFDTPIAQVAREDEGFFQLEGHAPISASDRQAESPTDDFSSVLPLIREKDQVRENPPPVPPIQVVAPLTAQGAQIAKNSPSGDPGDVNITKDLDNPAVAKTVKKDPFADLPKPKLPAPKPPVIATPLPVEEAPKPVEPKPRSPKPQRRRGLELLQELFLTDDFLDAAQVAHFLCTFPKVRAALIMLDDGTVLGGGLPENYQADAALPAPKLMRAVREFGTALSSVEVSACTLLADSPISIFLEGRVCILVVHEGRGLLPGMRDRFTQITKALDALYDPGDKGD
jgi:hypothetical protein